MPFRPVFWMCLLVLIVSGNAHLSGKQIIQKGGQGGYHIDHNASKAERKKASDAIWETISPPPDILSSLNYTLMKSTMAMYTPAELVELIQNISKKVHFGVTLSPLEEEVWDSTRAAIVQELSTSNCNPYYYTNDQEWGSCCRITAEDEYYGFCVYHDDLVYINTSGRTVQNFASDIRATSSRWYSSYVEATATDTIYVDLLSLTCRVNDVDLELCSQYCCDADNQDGLFCNSDIDCY